jgi:hypothetical protein
VGNRGAAAAAAAARKEGESRRDASGLGIKERLQLTTLGAALDASDFRVQLGDRRECDSCDLVLRERIQ